MFEPVDGTRMRLTRELSVSISSIPCVIHQVCIPAGYEFDGASIPRVAWSIIGAPFEPDFVLAACIHDWYCDRARCYHQRMIGDAVFFLLLARAGVPYWRRACMYAAVRVYGWLKWRGKR